MKLEVILDRYPYRFVQFGELESGYPDLEDTENELQYMAMETTCIT